MGNTPKLRFHGYSDDWQKYVVSDIFNITRGYVLPAPETDEIQSEEKPYPVYSSQTKNNGLMGYYKDYLYENAITWTTDGANAGTVKFRAGKFYCTNVCGVLLSEAGYANQMVSEALNSMAWKYVSKVGNPKLMNNTMAGIEICLPKSIEEQEKISELLICVDNLTSLLQRRCDAMAKAKQFYLQTMFPQNGERVPKLRFAGFMGDWEQCKLGECAEIVGGGTPSTNNANYWDGTIDWYAPAEITNRIYVNSSQRKITKAGYESCSAKMLPVGTILFTSRAGIGKTAILSKESCTNQGFQSIVPQADKLDSYFIFSRTVELKKYAEIVGAGSTFVEVSGKQMANMPLMMPPLSEQQAIGAFFQSLDNLITQLQRKVDALKTMKQFMLQNMFV